MTNRYYKIHQFSTGNTWHTHSSHEAYRLSFDDDYDVEDLTVEV